ncbi:MAG: polysaccharide pyruvyl transferase CsaB [Cyanobacteriota bacterium]|nr:polysaccharide pyruvyl transferase CsaB [Cyanobacteriota bacterium]
MRVVILGYYGFGNAGDEALLLSLLQMLPEHYQPCVLSDQPQVTAATYPVLSASRWSLPELWRLLGAADLFVWGGGSLLQDRSSWRSPLYYLAVMTMAQQRGVRTLAWAQGIGPLDRPWNRAWTRACLAGCQGVSVRDQAAAQLLEGWGIPYQLAPDPVWALQGLADPAGVDWPEGGIAVVLRTHPHLTPARLAVIRTALQRLQAKTEAPLFFVPFQLAAPHAPPSPDQQLAEQLQAQLPNPSHLLLLRDPRYLKGFLGKMRLTITMRYHGLVMAAAEGCRCFAVSYDPKVRHLLTALDMPGWDLEELPGEADSIQEAWLHHYYEGSPLSWEERQTWASQAEQHRQVLLDA